jgi:polar amino acid transport system substrate-binding protein
MIRRHIIRSTVAAVMALGMTAVSVPVWADAYDDIMERGDMIVAIDPTFAPFEYTDSEGRIIGYDPELLEAIAEDWGVEIDYQVMAFSGVIPGLIAGSFDFTATALNITAERAQKIDFTIPITSTVNAVLTTMGNANVMSSDINDLSGHGCAVKQTTQPEQMMQAMNEELSASGMDEVELLSFDTVEQTIAALADGRVDCVVDDIVVLHQAMASRPDIEMEVVGEIGTKAVIGWGTNKDDPKLNAALNEALKKLKANGTMGELQEKYFGFRVDNLPEENFIPEG